MGKWVYSSGFTDEESLVGSECRQEYSHPECGRVRLPNQGEIFATLALTFVDVKTASAFHANPRSASAWDDIVGKTWCLSALGDSSLNHRSRMMVIETGCDNIKLDKGTSHGEIIGYTLLAPRQTRMLRAIKPLRAPDICGSEVRIPYTCTLFGDPVEYDS